MGGKKKEEPTSTTCPAGAGAASSLSLSSSSSAQLKKQKISSADGGTIIAHLDANDDVVATTLLQAMETDDVREDVNVNITLPLPPAPLPNELICLGSPILDLVMSFLDKDSLKTCRQVCGSWEDAARRSLMKLTDLKVLEFFNNVSQSDYQRVELYSSWILEYNNNNKAAEGFLQVWGKGANCLTLKGLDLDEDENCLVWIRNVLSSWCPNVRELRLVFASDESWTVRRTNKLRVAIPLHKLRKTVEHYRATCRSRSAIGTLRVAESTKDDDDDDDDEDKGSSWPILILPKLQFLRVQMNTADGGGCSSLISSRRSADLCNNIISASPNLKHLFLSEMNGSRLWIVSEDPRDLTAGFDTIHFLSTRPDITMKLETFELQNDTLTTSGCCCSSSVYTAGEKDMDHFAFGPLMKPMDMPILKFGSKLKSLYWNVFYCDPNEVHAIPGVLEQVAGNLRKLDLRTVKIDVGRKPAAHEGQDDEHSPSLGFLTNHIFPLMPELISIQIEFRECFKLSLYDLVDAAPNLRSLEVWGCESCDIPWMNQHRLLLQEDIWGGPGLNVVQNHDKLKSFKAGMSMRNVEGLLKTIRKFPELEELCLGVEGKWETEVKLERIFEMLEELKSLKRFKWTICGPVDLAGVLKCFAEAGGKMEKLEMCHLRFICSDLDSFDAVDSDGFYRKETELLEEILVTRNSQCKFIVTADSEKIFKFKKKNRNVMREDWVEGELFSMYENLWKKLLFPHIESNALPIRFYYSPTPTD
jgi:hypothetical protein